MFGVVAMENPPHAKHAVLAGLHEALDVPPDGRGDPGGERQQQREADVRAQ
jgi:hypothetical protein